MSSFSCLQGLLSLQLRGPQPLNLDVGFLPVSRGELDESENLMENMLSNNLLKLRSRAQQHSLIKVLKLNTISYKNIDIAI